MNVSVQFLKIGYISQKLFLAKSRIYALHDIRTSYTKHDQLNNETPLSERMYEIFQTPMID